METVSDDYAKVPFQNFIYENTPVSAIRTATEHRLWHQRLLHMSDIAVKTAHEHVEGVPKIATHADLMKDSMTYQRMRFLPTFNTSSGRKMAREKDQDGFENHGYLQIRFVYLSIY